MDLYSSFGLGLARNFVSSSAGISFAKVFEGIRSAFLFEMIHGVNLALIWPGGAGLLLLSCSSERGANFSVVFDFSKVTAFWLFGLVGVRAGTIGLGSCLYPADAGRAWLWLVCGLEPCSEVEADHLGLAL